MDKPIRNLIQRATQDARQLLEMEYQEQLEGTFDILLDGTIAEEAGSHLDGAQCLVREKLVAAVEHEMAGGLESAEAVAAYLREAAFTTLNRFVALKMLEARGLVQECISKGAQSAGFREFGGLAPGLVALTDHGYRLYIESIFDEIGQEVRVLFDRRDPASLLWPRRQALDDLLGVLNQPELEEVWAEDETIGWFYQYFNSDEERRQMRAQSQAPRNSRELAVRNQFFTPRYVVEFLTDNTLGRIWYEMRQGQTGLVDECRYMVRRPNEVFLAEGEQPPEQESQSSADELSQEELLRQPVHIPFRVKKDPRDLKVLDPAVGSGHFLLYSFDVLAIICEEAWADEGVPKSEVTGRTLREDYPDLATLRAAAPGLILKHNLHGIEIDPRAAQIASLALWMRAQRAYNELGLSRGDRPMVERTNVVVAEPMPGDPDLLREFTSALRPPLLGQLVEVVFEKMKLAGEVGSLLKIEAEISDAVAEAKLQWLRGPKAEQMSLFAEMGPPEPEQLALLNGSGITDEQFWEQAELRIYEALQRFSEASGASGRHDRRLFADDAAAGLAFVDTSRIRFDVVLANPPFGLGPEERFGWLKDNYPNGYVDLYAAFVCRAMGMSCGKIGLVTSRSWLTAKKLSRLRQEDVVPRLEAILDLGHPVMDGAMVQALATVLDCAVPHSASTFSVFDRRALDEKHEGLVEATRFGPQSSFHIVDGRLMASLPDGKVLYLLPPELVSLFLDNATLDRAVCTAKLGMKTFDDFRFLRLRSEVDAEQLLSGGDWEPYAKGGAYEFFYSEVPLVVHWRRNGQEIAEKNRQVNGQTAQARQASSYYGRPGGTYSYRCKDFGVRALPAGCIISGKGPGIFPVGTQSPQFAIGLLNSRLLNCLVNIQANANQYDSGIINGLPWGGADAPTVARVHGACADAIGLAMSLSRLDERSAHFACPPVASTVERIAEIWTRTVTATEHSLSMRIDEINAAVDELYGVDSASLAAELLAAFGGEDDGKGEGEGDDIAPSRATAIELKDVSVRHVSYCVGCALGRWDIRKALDPSLVPDLPDPFALLPSCPPGLLSDPDGGPSGFGGTGQAVSEDSTIPPQGQAVSACGPGEDTYPIAVPHDGILVDDPGHPRDIARATECVLSTLSAEDDHEIGPGLARHLGAEDADLRQWLRKGFYSDHIRRYSESRRKAPIYWQLGTPSASYSVWTYYHRFSKDTLYTVLNDYVQPKLEHEERRLTRLAQEAGSSPTPSQRKDIDAQERFVGELRTFRDEVARVAPIWNPDLNDGVIINFAPLWRLVPHNRSWQKECKKVWDKLVKGDYDWAHLAMHIWPERVVPKCAEDRSLAIAHSIEDVFWCEDEDGKWERRDVPQEQVGVLIAERSSSSVKAALDDLLSAPAPSGTPRTRRRKRSTKRAKAS